MQQQRDALLIICIPCIDGEGGRGGATSELKAAGVSLATVIQCFGGRVTCLKWEIRKADQKEKG